MGQGLVPMALADDSTNFVLMQAMGPNVSGVIGSAVVAGILCTLCRIRYMPAVMERNVKTSNVELDCSADDIEAAWNARWIVACRKSLTEQLNWFPVMSPCESLMLLYNMVVGGLRNG